MIVLHLSTVLPLLAQGGTDRVDLMPAVIVGEPVLLELESEMTGAVRSVIDGQEEEQAFREARELTLVDEYKALSDDGLSFEARRDFVRCFSTVDDAPTDPELNGVGVDFVRREGDTVFELDGRTASDERIAELGHHADSLGLWLALPKAAEVGESFDVEPEGLLVLLSGARGALEQASGKLALKSVDDDGIATLEGQFQCLEERKDEGVVFSISTHGPCVVEVDTKARQVRRILWSGESQANSTLAGVRIEGKAEFRVEVRAERGKAADKARKKKPVYRQVVREPAGIPVAFELPSHWFRVAIADSGATRYQTSLHGADASIVLEVQLFAVPDGQYRDVVDTAVKKIESDFGKVKERTVSGRLGQGDSVRFDTRDGRSHYIEFYPLGDTALVRWHLFGSKTGVEKERKAWARVRSSMRRRS